ncbi:MAG: hypothetical protein HKM05_05835 [Spirochaetales bacterium]|nr:hypothetical protein [Spirochaetales bacterium]
MKWGRLVFLLLVLGALAGGGILFWSVFFPSSPPQIYHDLPRVDQDLVTGRFAQAKADLLRIPRENLSSMGWLSLLKRALTIAEKSGDWAFAQKLTQGAFKQFPGNLNFRAILVWEDLQQGKGSQALEKASELKGSAWNDLWLQASVEAQHYPEQPASIRVEDYLAGVLENPLTAPLNVLQSLMPLGEVSWNTDLVLAALSQVRLDVAVAALRSLSDQIPQSPLLKSLSVLVTADQHHWDQALTEDRKNTPLSDRLSLLLRAEILLHLHQDQKAQKIYDTLAVHAKNLPEAVYVNLVGLALRNHDLPGAEQWIAEAQQQQRWNSQAPIEKLLAWQVAFAQGKTQQVAQEMDRVLEEAKNEGDSLFSTQVELLRMSLWPATFSLPRLWSLFHEFPSFAPLAERLAWELMKQGRWHDARRVGDEWKVHSPDEPDWWYRYDCALIDSHENRFAEAWENLAKISRSERDGYYYYNRGLISLLAAQKVNPGQKDTWLRKAGESFSSALNQSADLGDSAFTADILYHRAEASLALLPSLDTDLARAVYGTAVQDLQTAVVLSPQNWEAGYLYRITTAKKGLKP